MTSADLPLSFEIAAAMINRPRPCAATTAREGHEEARYGLEGIAWAVAHTWRSGTVTASRETLNYTIKSIFQFEKIESTNSERRNRAARDAHLPHRLLTLLLVTSWNSSIGEFSLSLRSQ